MEEIKVGKTSNSINVYFSVDFQTQFGEDVVILGQNPELGKWILQHGLHLTTSANDYSIWFNKTPLKIVNNNITLIFKAVKACGNILMEWEQNQDRKIDLSSHQGDVLIEFYKNSPEIHVFDIHHGDVQDELCEISFKVNYKTQIGQEIAILGNCHSLGNWKVDRAHILKTNKSAYPIWYSPFPLKVRVNQTIQFKAVLLEKKKIVFWENLKQNRKVNIPANKNMVVEFEQSNSEQKVQYLIQQKDLTVLEKQYVDKLKQYTVIYGSFTSKQNQPNNFTIDVPKTGVSNSLQTQKRIQSELEQLSKTLPVSLSNSIFLCVDEKNQNMMKVLIFGTEGTSYAHGAFTFDLYLPPTYPNTQPKMNLTTTGKGQIRFNPNLYSNGYVCLSLLGTWSGSPEECWIPSQSNLFQLFTSIQSLIMNDDILYSEPGFDKLRGTKEGENKNRSYQNIVKQGNILYAMIEQIINPPKEFELIIKNHFFLKKKIILQTVENWIELAQYDDFYNTDYSGLVCSHNYNFCQLFSQPAKKFVVQLKNAYEQLKETLNGIQLK